MSSSAEQKGRPPSDTPVLSEGELIRLGEEFLDFVQRRRERGVEDYPFRFLAEEFQRENPYLEYVGRGAHRAVFRSDYQLPGEDSSVIKFPRGDVEKEFNNLEALTWDAIAEDNWDNEEWYAEVWDVGPDGEYLVQEEVAFPSPVAHVRAKYRFKVKDEGPDAIFMDLDSGNVGAKGGIFGHPKVVDFPWLTDRYEF